MRFDRADINSAIEAAKRLKSDRDLYVFATYLGYTIDGRPPPGMQQYVIVHPSGSTEMINPSLGGNPTEVRIPSRPITVELTPKQRDIIQFRFFDVGFEWVTVEGNKLTIPANKVEEALSILTSAVDITGDWHDPAGIGEHKSTIALWQKVANTAKEAGYEGPYLKSIYREKIEEGNPVPEVKEPWQMTQAEFAKVYPFPAGANAVHRSAVFGAIYQGKPVPAEVLADYPDLRTREGNPHYEVCQTIELCHPIDASSKEEAIGLARDKGETNADTTLIKDWHVTRKEEPMTEERRQCPALTMEKWISQDDPRKDDLEHCRPCLLGVIAQWYHGELQEQGHEELAQNIEQIATNVDDPEMPLTLCKEFDRIKNVVEEPLRERLKDFDCSTQSFNPDDTVEESTATLNSHKEVTESGED